MRISHLILYILLCLGLAISIVHGAPKLETAKIKSLYIEGEFEAIREALEKFLKQSDRTASREDRIMAYKYLGVVYASDADGAPQAEAYFFRLFDLAPQVTLTELYVSSAVNQIFKNTRDRFLSERKSIETVDEFGNPISGRRNDGDAMTLAANKQPATDVTREKPPKTLIKGKPENRPSLENSRQAIWPWLLGAAVIGGGVGLYVLTAQKDSPATEIIKAGSD